MSGCFASYSNYLWLLFIIFQTVFTQTTDKYTDENRPYKFGFNIEGYQHRQEQKDEKGIIKGEYGFITADGYYRVTVYATDENGDFRIISMKNYYVGFPPENPTTTPGSPTAVRQGSAGLSSFGGISERKNKAPPATSDPQRQQKRPQGLSACSDCYIPTTPNSLGSKLNGGPEANVKGKVFSQEGRGRERFPGPINLNSIPDFPNSFSKSNFQNEKSFLSQSNLPNNNQPSRNFEGFKGPGSFGTSGIFKASENPAVPRGPGSPGTFGTIKTSKNPAVPRGPDFPEIFGTLRASESPEAPGSQYFGKSNPQKQNTPGSGFFGLNKNDPTRDPVVALKNTQLDNGANRKPQIGEVKDGLPPGVPLSVIKDLLLYRFNYTVGFHGHHEDGYRNGDKEGDYFFDGRDGVERKVEYLANEFGYQPNITLIDLQENDVRRPKEETEKEYGLKGYEFKWFYRK